MSAKYDFKGSILIRLMACWRILTHKTYIAYTTDDIHSDWQLSGNGNFKQFGEWLVKGEYKNIDNE